MHTTRNHIARKSGKAARAIAARAPAIKPPHDDEPFMLRQVAPPHGFPSDLIVPAHRGAVITPTPWPNAPERRPGRKAAKREARKAAAIARTQAAAPQPAVEPVTVIKPVDVPPIAAGPVRSEPEAGPPVATGFTLAAFAAAVPAMEVQPSALELPATTPLPAGRALVVQRQGFIDVLATVLRSSGLRLARWSSARRRADELKDKLAKAEARLRAMEAQMAALQAIQQRLS
jgi:hypothetical protein